MGGRGLGAAKKGLKVEILVADHQTAEVGSSIGASGSDVDKVDVIVTCDVSWRSRQPDRGEKNKVLIVSRARPRPLRQGVHTEHAALTYDTCRSPTAPDRGGQNGGTLVFPNRDYALAIRSSSRPRRGAEARRQGGGKVRHVPVGDIIVPAAEQTSSQIIGLQAGADTINAIKQGRSLAS